MSDTDTPVTAPKFPTQAICWHESAHAVVASTFGHRFTAVTMADGPDGSSACVFHETIKFCPLGDVNRAAFLALSQGIVSAAGRAGVALYARLHPAEQVDSTYGTAGDAEQIFSAALKAAGPFASVEQLQAVQAFMHTEAERLVGMNEMQIARLAAVLESLSRIGRPPLQDADDLVQRFVGCINHPGYHRGTLAEPQTFQSYRVATAAPELQSETRKAALRQNGENADGNDD